MSPQDFSRKTRDIYHHQHKRIARDKRAMERFINMFSSEYFGLGRDYFKGKKILDAGCGDTAKVMIALYRLGAREIHGMDLGREFIPVAEESLARHQVPLECLTLKSGSVLDIPYEDDSFDFVVCHGVLVHLNSIEEVRQAFGELARVTRPGGHLYSVYGIVGGLMEEAVIPAVREYYRKNTEFRTFIDQVSPKDFHGALDAIMDGMDRHGGEAVDLDPLKPLLDVDFCVFLQNITQVPIRLSIGEEQIKELYNGFGFKEIRRLRRFVKRKNIRKFAAPLHFDIDNPISRLIYGSGNLEFIAQKR